MRFFGYKPIIHLILIGIFTLLAYSNTYEVPFRFDDESYIMNNPLIKDIRNFLEPSTMNISDLPENVRHTIKTRYVGYLTFWANYRLDVLNVTGYHVFNIVVHIINAFLVYLFVSLIFKSPILRGTGLKEDAGLIAFFSALLFSVHPVQTQAVTYLTQRFASLATMWYLLAIIVYVGSRLSDRNESKYFLYMLSFLFVAVAMKTKEIAFTLPMSIAIIEIMFFTGHARKRFALQVPFLLTMLIIPLSLMDSDKPFFEAFADSSRTEEAISRHDYLSTQLRVIATYIRLLALPINQNLDYDYPIFSSVIRLSVFSSLLSILVLFGLGIYLYYRARRKGSGLQLVAFGIFWFFVTLSVESSVITLSDVIFEHRLYLPSIGAILAVISSMFIVSGKMGKKKRKTILIGTLVIMAIVFTAAAFYRNSIWTSVISLCSDTVEKSPYKARVHNNLGLAYYNEGNTGKALEHYLFSRKLSPHSAELQMNLGNAYLALGQYDEAIESFSEAVNIKPDFAKAYHNLGLSYGRKNLIDEEMGSYQKALSLKPELIFTHLNLGDAYAKRGLFEEALQHYNAARFLRPEFPDIYFRLGVISERRGLIDEAQNNYERAIGLNPDFADAHLRLGRIYFNKGLKGDARKEFNHVLRLRPGNEGIREYLDKILKE